MAQLNVAVLMGGVSRERDVSLRSGRAVAEALMEAGDEVRLVDVRSEDLSGLAGIDFDLVFPALHGRFGEDGTLQAQLEEAQIPYVGSDSQASRAAMDKMASKCFFVAQDVPTAPFRLVTKRESAEEVKVLVDEVTLPLVVKPLCQGSSIGVTLARRMEEVSAGLACAFRYGNRAIMERYILGREFTVGILDDQALPLVELRPNRPFFDYHAKYEDDATEFIIDPELPEEVGVELQTIAMEAHVSLGCQGLSRVDLMLEEDGCPYVLEVNTIPGFTGRSLYPMAARRAGIEFHELCHRLCEQAMVTPRVRPVVA